MSKKQTKETKSKRERYISRFGELKLIDKASYTKEVEGRIVVVAGKSIQFHDGKYEASDPQEIQFLDNHPNYGNVFYKLKSKEGAEKAREEQFKSLEEKEKELAAREKAVEEKEMGKKGHEEGAKPSAKGVRGTESTKSEKPKF